MATKQTESVKKMGRPVAQNANSPIARLRAKLQISQAELGVILGKSHPSINRYENGKVKPTGLVLKALNQMLKENDLPEI